MNEEDVISTKRAALLWLLAELYVSFFGCFLAVYLDKPATTFSMGKTQPVEFLETCLHFSGLFDSLDRADLFERLTSENERSVLFTWHGLFYHVVTISRNCRFLSCREGAVLKASDGCGRAVLPLSLPLRSAG